MACNVQELINEAACFACVEPIQRQLAIVSLLCQVSQGGGGGGGSITIQKDGVLVASDVTVINFTGAGVTVTDEGGGTVSVAVLGLPQFFTYAGNPNGNVEATGPAQCYDTVSNITWVKTTAGTSNNEWI